MSYARGSEEDIPNNVVVLNGTVKGAKSLPMLSSEERDGRAFFRVLHVEGGSKSTMFRCKTMIYNSEMSTNAEEPSWSDGNFRFEMIIPEDEFGVQEVHGEILVAVYRSRWQGGNDFIGQASFDLSKLVSMDIGYPGDIEHNTVRGCFDLIDRQGRVAGDSAEVEAVLEFSWRVPPDRPQTKQPPEISSREPSPTRSKMSNKSKRPASAGGNTGGIRRIQSAQSAKKKAEQIRIDLENKALQARIQRSGTQAAKNKVGDMYKKAQATVAPKDAVTSKMKSTQGGSSLAAKSPAELQQLLATMKARSAAAEKENTTLRAQLTKEKGASKRMEADISRMRSQEIGTASYGAGEDIMDALAIDRENIADSELKEMLGEHDALQNSRRQLLRRARQSKAAHTEISNKLQAAESKLKAAWDNVSSTAGDGVDSQSEGYSSAREIRNIEAEILSLEVDMSQGSNSAVRDEISEERIINSNIKAKLALAKEELERNLYERDICSDRLSALQEEGVMVNLKTVITTLRSAYYRCQRRLRIDGINKKAEAIELEFLKHCPE